MSDHTPKVLISDKLSEKAAEIFRDRGVEADVKTGLKPEELMDIIGQYDGLAVRSSTKVTKEILEAAENLKVIGRAGIGVDNIDTQASTQRGVVVMNTPYGNSITTAEHAIAMMLSLARQIPQANESTQAGKWEKSKFMGVEVHAKTLGLIGAGNIGALVGQRARGMGMRVIAYDPYLTEERAREIGFEKADLDTLYRRADFITLHTPLTEATKHMIDRTAFAKMKDGVRVINCARGGLVVEADLKEALDSGKVAGAALDVFEVEPARDNSLFGHPNLVCTPHLGASTTEAQEKVALQVAEQMSDYLMTGAVTNALNMPSVTAEEAPLLRPYMKLSEQIGSFLGQIADSAINSVRIEYEGDVADLNTKPLTANAMAGLLRPQLEQINVVSAPIVAQDRGIDISETKREQCRDFHARIRMEVRSDKATWSVAGTVFAGDLPRIVSVEEVPIEAEIYTDMLFVRNIDQPGLIGAVGTALGNAGVNIASFHLGRVGGSGTAVALVAVDAEIPHSVIKEVAALPNVDRVKALKFT